MPNLGNLLYKLQKNSRKLYRTFEQKNKQRINSSWSYKFNYTCLKENIWPKYTTIRHHDPGLKQDPNTNRYRKYLIERELEKCSATITSLTSEIDQLRTDINGLQIPTELKTPVETEITNILQNHELVTETRIIKKLNWLYKGNLKFKMDSDSFINLSDYTPTKEQKQFLNMGLNYHIQPKYNKLEKSTHLEILYQDLLKLEAEEKVTINHEICHQLRNESTKQRNCHYKSKLTPTLRKAAKELFENPNIIIRKADKNSTYVIMNKTTYLSKLDQLISDTTKFKEIKKDPTNSLKTKANKLISTVNATQSDIKLNKIKGEYKPGYIYGTVKVHKENNPLRPIISQVTSPIYQLSKTLNEIITPYIPSKYSLKSTYDFIDILQSNNFIGNIASLDVESLFTNVPLDNTINIIIDVAYNHPTIRAPKIPQNLLKNLLELCTKESPFTTPNGKIFKQIEGVAMGSPLGPLFANFYMGYLEEITFSNSNNKLPIYARYVDDIFIKYHSEEDLQKLKTNLEEKSVLKFTVEKSIDNKLPFLDVMISKKENTFHTEVFHKKTDKGQCLNSNSECPDKYKDSVIKNYIKRAFKLSTTWESFHNELIHIKQMLVNNNYSNSTIDHHINKFLQQKFDQNEPKHEETVCIYYQAQMHNNYKKDERIIKEIIARNVKSTKNQKLKTIIFYKNMKTSNLVIKNNIVFTSSALNATNVVYKFKCNYLNCKSEYIGHTQLSLQNRLTAHYYNGSIKNHYQQVHNIKVNKETLFNNTEVITKEKNYRKLAIKECLLILEQEPRINIQFNNFFSSTKLFQRRNNIGLEIQHRSIDQRRISQAPEI